MLVTPLHWPQCCPCAPPHKCRIGGPGERWPSPVCAIPVEDGGAVGADGGVAVEGEEHVALLAELADEAFRLAALGQERAEGPNGAQRGPCQRPPHSTTLAPWESYRGSRLNLPCSTGSPHSPA